MSGSVARQSLALQLLPANKTLLGLLQQSGYNPLLQISVAAHNTAGFLIKHIQRKWASKVRPTESLLTAQVRLFPPNHKTLGHPGWTVDSKTPAAQLYLDCGSPAKFQLLYGYPEDSAPTAHDLFASPGRARSGSGSGFGLGFGSMGHGGASDMDVTGLDDISLPPPDAFSGGSSGGLSLVPAGGELNFASLSSLISSSAPAAALFTPVRVAPKPDPPMARSAVSAGKPLGAIARPGQGKENQPPAAASSVFAHAVCLPWRRSASFRSLLRWQSFSSPKRSTTRAPLAQLHPGGPAALASGAGLSMAMAFAASHKLSVLQSPSKAAPERAPAAAQPSKPAAPVPAAVFTPAAPAAPKSAERPAAAAASVASSFSVASPPPRNGEVSSCGCPLS